MNSTSAADRAGRGARVDGGRVLLGAPGAPGCTTTGFAGSVCCARAEGEKKTAEMLAASKARTASRSEPGRSLCSRRKRTCLELVVRAEIPIWTDLESFHEIGNFKSVKDKREHNGSGF